MRYGIAIFLTVLMGAFMMANVIVLNDTLRTAGSRFSLHFPPSVDTTAVIITLIGWSLLGIGYAVLGILAILIRLGWYIPQRERR